MRKYPFVKQYSYNDCGPACIQMILMYYGGYMNYNKIRMILETNKNGTNVYNMVNCLNYLGFKANAYKYNDIKNIKIPCIVHLNYKKYTHYVLIYKINYNKKYLIIGDPSLGVVKISFTDFISRWSGICINILYIGNIMSEDKPKILPFFSKFFKDNFFNLLFVGLISLFLCLLSIFTSYFIQIIISNYKDYVKLLWAFGFVLFFKLLFDYLRDKLFFKIDYNISNYLYKDTFKKLIFLPYSSSKNKTIGESLNYFNDLLLIKDVFNNLLIICFIYIPLLFILSFILFLFDYRLFLMCLIIFLIYFVYHKFFYNKNYYLSSNFLREKCEVTSFITERLSGFESINNLNVNEKVVKDFSSKYDKYLFSNRKLFMAKIKEKFLKNLIDNVFLLLFLFYGAFSISKGFLIGNFITLYFLFSLFNSSVRGVFEINFDLFYVIGVVRKIMEIPVYSKNVISVDGDISVSNLFYKDILKDINLFITKGSKVMISGVSGSGKSTLFKIIKGYYDYSGIVKIGGYDSNKYCFDNVIYVSSFEYLFTGKVVDNLSFRKYFEINNEICEIDFPLDDYVLENGFNFSRGQKDRIILSRALSDFNIIIIDEALDGVDVDMERRILKNIFKFYSNKTVIFISHRLDNLDLFDRFIRMDKGRIILDEVRNER